MLGAQLNVNGALPGLESPSAGDNSSFWLQECRLILRLKNVNLGYGNVLII